MVSTPNKLEQAKLPKGAFKGTILFSTFLGSF